MKHVECARETAKIGILIVAGDLDRACQVRFADTSWAKALGLNAKIGALVLLVDIHVLLGPTPRAPPCRKSKRTPRVVRSTLAGEAFAQAMVCVRVCVCVLSVVVVALLLLLNSHF